MTKRPGRNTRRKSGRTPAQPLDYALRIMRDDTQSAALRASMAKAALPYLHERTKEPDTPDEEPDRKPPMSDLELARRIAHILVRADAQRGPA